MDEKKKKVQPSIEIIEVPYPVEVPTYVKKEMPEYVLVKEEVVYKVPRVKFEDKTYERPIVTEKEYILPVYVEKEYEIPKYVEKVYEVPKMVEKVIEVPVYKYIEKEELKVNLKEIPYDVRVPKIVQQDVKVVNAIVEDKHVTNAVIEHVTVEALHPKYLCSKCKKEPV